MAYENVTEVVPGLVAAADLSAKQYTFGLINSSGKVAANTSAGGVVDGVIQDKPDAADKACSLGVAGVTKVVAGTGGVTAGDLVMSAADGTGVTATTTNFFAGRALRTAAAGEIFPMQLGPNGYVP